MTQRLSPVAAPRSRFSALRLGLIAVSASIALWALSARPASAATVESELKSAIEAADKGRFSEAARLATGQDQPLITALVTWRLLQVADSPKTFDQISRFIALFPDWPGRWRLESYAEDLLPADMPAGAVVTWFGDRFPRTANGAYRLGQALQELGQTDALRILVQRAWIELNFGSRQERDFLRRFGTHIDKTLHLERLERLIWERSTSQARRQMRRVEPGYRALAEARIRLYGLEGGVDPAIARVPTALRDHPGLVFERLKWRRRKGRYEDAIELLASPSANGGQPEMWWTERHILARHLMDENAYDRAYTIASRHGLSPGGIDYAEAEWLSGFLALRYLDQPAVALRHFEALYDAVGSPVSRSRADYWAGRATEAQIAADAGSKVSAGRHTELKAKATLHYGRAALLTTTYYGQLAARRLDPGKAWRLPEFPPIDARDRTLIRDSQLFQATQILHALDRDDLAYLFAQALDNTLKTEAQRVALVEELMRIGDISGAVALGRRLRQDGLVTVGPAYPRPEIITGNDVETSLVRAVARQESNFDSQAVSPAGARGLMQLMPATASRIAKSAGTAYSRSRLTADAAYNIRLGSAYLQRLLDRYDGTYVLSIAAYNAGPSRVSEWIRRYGDPREGDSDAMIDWIERIPFSETRNYVQRVIENLQVYRRLEGAPLLAASLQGRLDIKDQQWRRNTIPSE